MSKPQAPLAHPDSVPAHHRPVGPAAVHDGGGWIQDERWTALATEMAEHLAPVQNGVLLLQIRSGARLIAGVLEAVRRQIPFVLASPTAPRVVVQRLHEAVRPAAVLTDLPAGHDDLQWTVSDGLWLGRRSDAAPSGRDWGYLVSTSGSTGTPRVCVIGRSSLHHHVRRIVDAYELGPDDVVIQASTPGFDVWIEEVLPSADVGARIVTLPTGLVTGAAEFTELIERTGGTVVNVPGSFWRVWTEWLSAQPARTLPRSLRLVVVGSEPVPAASVRVWLDHFPRRPRLLSAYGLAEATVTSFLYDVTRNGVDAEDSLVPLGRPLPGTTYALKLVRPGAAELLLRGVDRQVGYLGDPRTQTSTVPVADVHTGDLVKETAAGLAFVGRVDDLVKIHGVRLSPHEPETVLLARPDVADCAVVATGEPQARQLVAAVVPLDRFDERAARAAVADALSHSHVPARFLLMDRLPSTVNGKVDRQALADGARTASPPAGQADPVERTMSAVLGVPVGQNDDFFELGGNSLLAAQLLTQLERDFGRRWTLGDVFRLRTPSALRTSCRDGSRPGPEPLSRAVPRSRSALSAQQVSVWFFELLEPGSAAYHCQSSIEFDGPADADRLVRAFQRVVDAHGVYRTSIGEDEGVPYQQVHSTAHIEVDVREVTTTRWTRLRADFIARPFDLAVPPLLRALLMRDGERSLLVVVEHHLVHDGYSFVLMLRMLMQAYETDAPVNGSALSYLDYVAWQDRMLSGAYGDELVRYWSESLQGAADLQPLAIRPYERGRQRTAASIRVIVDQPVVDAARILAREGGPTLFTSFVAALEIVLARACRQDDFCLGIAAANRRTPGSEDILGMFVNPLPVRATLRPGATVRDLRQDCAAAVLDALEHQELPFAKIVRSVQRGSGIDTNPIFQALIGFDDGPVPAISLGPTQGHLVELFNGAPKLPLTIIVVPQREQRAGTAVPAHADVAMVWEFDEDLLSRPAVDVLIRGFGEALAAVTGHPDTPLDAVCRSLDGALLDTSTTSPANAPSDAG